MKELEYYNFQRILKWLGFDYKFEKDHNQYPFNRGKENVTFSWGQMLIPKHGIREMVQNKISDIKDKPLNSIKMMYQMPFLTDNGAGVINRNISLNFRYDKEWKYGDITKSIYECCFWILEHSEETNDFYIIKNDLVLDFLNACVVHNQWGLGAMVVCSTPSEKYQ